MFTLTTTDDSQYLQSLSFDTYNGRTWSNGPTTSLSVKQGDIAYDSSTDLRAVQQRITVVNPPGEQFPYLFGASQIASSGQAAQVVRRKGDGSDGGLAAHEWQASDRNPVHCDFLRLECRCQYTGNDALAQRCALLCARPQSPWPGARR